MAKELLPYYTHRSELMYHEDISLEIVLDTLHSEMKSIIINDILELKIQEKICFSSPVLVTIQ